MKLTDEFCRKIIPAAKPKRYTDVSEGLSLHVSAARDGAKAIRSWHLKFTDIVTGKRTTKTIGKFPDMNTAAARKKAEDIRYALSKGTNPIKRKARRQPEPQSESPDKVGALIDDWLADHKAHRKSRKSKELISVETLERKRDRVHEFMSRYAGYDANGKHRLTCAKEPKAVTAGDAEAILAVVGEKANYSAHLLRGWFTACWKWAMKFERVASNPWPEVEMITYKHASKAKLGPDGIGELWNDLQAYSDEYASIGLRVLMLTALRPSELRLCRWRDVDLDGSRDFIGRARPARAIGPAIYISADRMKMARAHFVPLSGEAVRLLKRLRAITYGDLDVGPDAWVFPSRRLGLPISDSFWQMACHKIGDGRWSGKFTPHACRKQFSTECNDESPFNWRVIEEAIAHQPVRITTGSEKHYNESEARRQRKELMLWWADFVLEVARNMEREVTGAGNDSVSARSVLLPIGT